MQESARFGCLNATSILRQACEARMSTSEFYTDTYSDKPMMGQRIASQLANIGGAEFRREL